MESNDIGEPGIGKPRPRMARISHIYVFGAPVSLESRGTRNLWMLQSQDLGDTRTLESYDFGEVVLLFVIVGPDVIITELYVKLCITS